MINVYGVVDIQGVFHLICLMLTSHETESDFLHLYNGLLKQAEIMDLDWEPDFSMQDACRASLNAIAKVQPSTGAKSGSYKRAEKAYHRDN